MDTRLDFAARMQYDTEILNNVKNEGELGRTALDDGGRSRAVARWFMMHAEIKRSFLGT